VRVQTANSTYHIELSGSSTATEAVEAGVETHARMPVSTGKWNRAVVDISIVPNKKILRTTVLLPIANSPIRVGLLTIYFAIDKVPFDMIIPFCNDDKLNHFFIRRRERNNRTQLNDPSLTRLSSFDLACSWAYICSAKEPSELGLKLSFLY